MSKYGELAERIAGVVILDEVGSLDGSLPTDCAAALRELEAERGGLLEALKEIAEGWKDEGCGQIAIEAIAKVENK